MENFKKNSVRKKRTVDYTRLLVALDKYFLAVVIVISIAALAGGFRLLIWPSLQEIDGLKTKAAELNNEKNKNPEIIAGLNNLLAAYASISDEEKGKVDLLLPSEQKAEDLISQLDSIITSNGFTLPSINVDEKKTSGKKVLSSANNASQNKKINGVESLGFSLSVGGTDYSNLKRLLNVLETNLRLLNINDLSFSNQGKTASLQGETYYYAN